MGVAVLGITFYERRGEICCIDWRAMARIQGSQALLACGAETNADTNAARNIMDLALHSDSYRRWNTLLLDVGGSCINRV